MAQVLKESSREAILQAASAEFLEKGFKNASMRSIAKKAGMTVGNLYRYFENKDKLYEKIIDEASSDLSKIISDLRFQNIAMEPRVYNAKVNSEELYVFINKLVDRLASIHERSADELSIIMMTPKCGKELTVWLHSIIVNLIDQHYYLEDDKPQRTLMAKSYAIAMHAGIREIIRNHEGPVKSLKSDLKTYLHSYVRMLENDFTVIKD